MTDVPSTGWGLHVPTSVWFKLPADGCRCVTTCIRSKEHCAVRIGDA